MGVKVSTRGNPVEPVHLNNLMVGLRGWGVQSGLAVAEKAAGADMSVDVAIGVAVVNLTVVTKASTTNVAVSAADATYDRYDLVVMNSSGTISVVAGTAAATSYANDYDLVANNAIMLAEVYVPAGDTTIEDAQITDFRNILQGLLDTTSGHDHDGTDSKLIETRFTEYDGFSEGSEFVATDAGIAIISAKGTGADRAAISIAIDKDDGGADVKTYEGQTAGADDFQRVTVTAPFDKGDGVTINRATGTLLASRVYYFT